MLRSDLNFILGKVAHKREDFEQALAFYYQTVKVNPRNFAATFCMAKIHFLNCNYNAVEEALAKILQDSHFKDSFEAIHLLAKVKALQGKQQEALVLYKRLIEINPLNYQACFAIAQLFDTND